MVQRRTPGLAQMGDAAAHWVDLLLRCPLCDKAKHESLVPHRGLPIPGQWQQRGPPAQSGGWGEPPDECFCLLCASSACRQMPRCQHCLSRAHRQVDCPRCPGECAFCLGARAPAGDLLQLWNSVQGWLPGRDPRLLFLWLRKSCLVGILAHPPLQVEPAAPSQPSSSSFAFDAAAALPL